MFVLYSKGKDGREGLEDAWSIRVYGKSLCHDVIC